MDTIVGAYDARVITIQWAMHEQLPYFESKLEVIFSHMEAFSLWPFDLGGPRHAFLMLSINALAVQGLGKMWDIFLPKGCPTVK